MKTMNRMQQLAGILKENSNDLPEKYISDYWSIMVDEQPEDVKKILTDLTTGNLSFNDFITNTDHDVRDSFRDEVYDDDYDDEDEY